MARHKGTTKPDSLVFISVNKETATKTLKETRNTVMDLLFIYDTKVIAKLIKNGCFPQTRYRMECDELDLRSLFVWTKLQEEISRFTDYELAVVKALV
jgi:hypothetical protein